MIAYMKVISFLVGIHFLFIKSTLCGPIPAPDVLFTQIDTNNDAFLDIDELRNWIMDWIGNKSVEFVPMDRLLECIDLDHDGELSSEELQKWANDQNAPDWLIKIMPEHDKNNDGKLDKQELKELKETMMKKYFGEVAPVEDLIRICLQEIYRKTLQARGIDPDWYDLNKDGKMGEFEFGIAQMTLTVLDMFNLDGDLKVSKKEFGDPDKQRKLSEFFAAFEAGIKDSHAPNMPLFKQIMNFEPPKIV